MKRTVILAYTVDGDEAFEALYWALRDLHAVHGEPVFRQSSGENLPLSTALRAAQHAVERQAVEDHVWGRDTAHGQKR